MSRDQVLVSFTCSACHKASSGTLDALVTVYPSSCDCCGSSYSMEIECSECKQSHEL